MRAAQSKKNTNKDSKIKIKPRAKTKDPIRTSEKNTIPEKMDITYVKPDKPLIFSFTDAITLDQLLDKEPTSGKRKKITEKRVTDNERSDTRGDLQNISNINIDDESPEKNTESSKKKKEMTKVEANEIIEGSLRGDKGSEVRGKKNMMKIEETKKEEPKNKVRYKTYTNTVILANNKLRTIEGIHAVLIDLLPDPEFNTLKSKIELVQWIDISRNKLTDIHEHITFLPFLKILYLHGNNIQEIEKVEALSRCPSLTSLTLYGNPIDHIKGYRHFIIEMVPLLEKLDYALVSEKELDIIHFKGSRYGEVRKNGVVVKYPKLAEEILKTIRQAEENNSEKKDDE